MKFLLMPLGALVCASLAVPVAAHSASTPTIRPKKIELFHIIVTGKRMVLAYAAALGASTSPMGEVQCVDNDSGGVVIKRTAIFRVESTSRYFDLSKLCTNDIVGYDYPYRSTAWRHWQHLLIGEAAVLRILRRSERLSIPRC